MPVAFNNSDTLNKIDTLSYFVKCAEHYVTSRETSRESFAKWLSVASRPELISTIKGDVNANCSQSTVKSKDVCVTIKRLRECLFLAVS